MFELDLRHFQNAVVIDAAALSDIFDGYRISITPAQLADLFNLIDQMILRDRIILTGGSRLLSSGSARELDLWTKEDALWLPKSRVTPIKFNPDRCGTTFPNSLGSVDPSRVVRSVGRLAGAEQKWKLPGMPLGGQRHFYDEITAIDLEEKALLDLTFQFSRLTNGIEDSLWRTASSRLVVNITLPPLAYMVFRQIDRIDQFQAATLDQRHKFSDLRKDLRELVELLRDETRSDQKKLAEVRKWERAWTRAATVDITPREYGFRIGSTALPNALWSMLGLLESPEAMDLSALVDIGSTAWDVAQSYYNKNKKNEFLLRPVYATLEQYLATNQIERMGIISRVVGRQLETSRMHARVRSSFTS